MGVRILKQNESDATLRRVFFVLVDSATAKVLQTGKAGILAGYVTKKGATPTAVAGSFAEVHVANQPGLYYYQATAGELDTVGRLVFRFTCTDCVERTILTHVGVTREDIKVDTGAIDGRLPPDPADQSAVEAAIAASELGIRGADSDDLKVLSDQTDDVPTTAEIDTELTAAHGSGSWKGDDGGGASVVTITVRDSVTLDGVPDVGVQVFNTGLTTLISSGTTDANGHVVFSLDDGTYKVMLRKLACYSFANPFDLTVSGATEETYEGDAFSPSTPPTPETCVVFGSTYDTGSNPISVEVIADLVEPKKFTTAGIQVIKQARTVSSAVLDGYWELVLTRSAEYTAPTVKYSFRVNGIIMCEYVIPDQAQVAFADLPENQP